MLEGKVTRMRRLLQEATESEIPRSTAWLRSGPLGAVRRKGLISDARLLASRYSLQEHMDNFIYRAGCEAVTGLDVTQLEHLVAILAGLGGSLDASCDSPGVPPAR